MINSFYKNYNWNIVLLTDKDTSNWFLGTRRHNKLLLYLKTENRGQRKESGYILFDKLLWDVQQNYCGMETSFDLGRALVHGLFATSDRLNHACPFKSLWFFFFIKCHDFQWNWARGRMGNRRNNCQFKNRAFLYLFKLGWN